MSTPTNKKPFKDINKKNLKDFIGVTLYMQIERCAHHHSGIMDVAVRLVHLCGNRLLYRDLNFVDKTLIEALAIWQSNIHGIGISRSYQLYCKHILDQLSYILDFQVEAIANNHTKLRYTWDCLREGYYEWLHKHNLNPASVDVKYMPVEQKLDNQVRAFLLAHHVFSRNDLQHLGLASEQRRLTSGFGTVSDSV